MGSWHALVARRSWAPEPMRATSRVLGLASLAQPLCNSVSQRRASLIGAHRQRYCNNHCHSPFPFQLVIPLTKNLFKPVKNPTRTLPIPLTQTIPCAAVGRETALNSFRSSPYIGRCTAKSLDLFPCLFLSHIDHGVAAICQFVEIRRQRGS
jgi:hypothetical protein